MEDLNIDRSSGRTAEVDHIVESTALSLSIRKTEISAMLDMLNCLKIFIMKTCPYNKQRFLSFKY